MDELNIYEQANRIATRLVTASVDAIDNLPSWLIGEAREAELAFHYNRMERLTTPHDTATIDLDYNYAATRVA